MSDRSALLKQVGDAVLVARGIRKTYDPTTSPVRALRGANLSLRRGELVALVGPSGCGKSTFLHVVAGLERPDDGAILVGGEEVMTLSEAGLARMRRRHVGLVFQFFNLLEGMTALENVALAALVTGASRPVANSRSRRLLDLLGLLDKATVSPAALSGGQRQPRGVRTCVHGGEAGVLQSGLPRCPLCRRHARAAARGST